MKFSTFLFASLLLFSCSKNAENGEISASGTIESVDVNVGTKAVGEVLQLNFSEGTRVKSGDTLALLDHSSLDLQLQQAQAIVSAAEAQLQLLLNGARIEDIEATQEALKQAEANQKSAEDDARRLRSLFASGSAPAKQKDDAETRLTIAQAQANSARQTLKKMQKFARPEDVKGAGARLDQAKAAANLLRKTINDCAVLAPVGGIITAKPIERGELATQGAIIAKISNLDKLEMMMYVRESELGKVKLGQAVAVSVDSYPNRQFPAKVVYISPQAEFTPKNVQTKEDRVKLVFGVKLEIENPDGSLKAGMPADATLKNEK